MTRNRTKRAFFLFPATLLILCLLFPAPARKGVQEGMDLVLTAALPNLFIPLVLSRMICLTLKDYQSRNLLLLPYLLGLFCGYPIGAITVSELYRRSLIPRKDADWLLFCSNNTGAAFLFNVCPRDSDSFREGLSLFLLQFVFTLIPFLLLYFKKRTSEAPPPRTPTSLPPFSSLFISSLTAGIRSFSLLAACIFFFSFLKRLILFLFPLPPLGNALVSLFLELTGGISALKPFSSRLHFILCAAGCGWAGLSVHLQTAISLEENGLSFRPFLQGKIYLSLGMAAGAFFLSQFLR